MQLTYLPIQFRIENEIEELSLKKLLIEEKVFVKDNIYDQLKEYIKCINPSKNITNYDSLINTHLKGKDIYKYGVWVYYPWNKNLVHILDKDEFVAVRTNRNKYKITEQEQNILDKKKVGIVGLSVGHSVATTMATERICGELRLADFDSIELSNLNRLRTPLYNLGLKKTIVAAREIAEIDPFITVKVFNDGLTEENLEMFFTETGKIDLFVEVCDGLDIKIKSRYKAKELNVPVIMDTNDRGMLDIERFDLEPNRSILHGFIGNDICETKALSIEERLQYIYKILDIDNISPKLKFSISEIGKSISTWPQLASSTALGGAMTTDISRKILLEQHNSSGRYYVDFDELIR